MNRRTLVRVLAAMAAILAVTAAVIDRTAAAEEVVLRVHHFLPPASTAQTQLIEPWAKRVTEESDGRIKVQIFPSMQLGGKPPQLFDQVRDGVVDVVWTLAGYTPGRFPKLEVLELPFVPGAARATSAAAHAYAMEYAEDELSDVHPILVHVHAPGTLHMKKRPIRNTEDIKGAVIRVPNRPVNAALTELGASPIGMPVPQVPEALSRGVIDGAVLPFEVTRPLRIHELTDSHTEFGGDRGLYTAVFLYLMNKDTYEKLPDDLKQVIDDNAGIELALKVGEAWDKAEEPGRKAAADLGHAFYVIDGAELDRWKAATKPAIDEWVKERAAAGDDGQALLDAAEALIDQYSR
ncbi:MAG: TRAP transporter substrate-binding protein [Rhodospirillales bacterium]|nr:TRAP transporter substrate-binding protein [Rhodospirillales bacterium]